DEVAAEVCPTQLMEMGHRGEASVCFLRPGRVRPGWSGGPVTRADTGAVIAVFHSVFRPNKQPDLAFPCGSLLFQLVPLLKSAGADPAAFAHPAPPTHAHAADAADRVARQIRSLTLAVNGDWRRVEEEQRENLKLEPESADAHLLLGLARAAEGDLDAAIGEFRAADDRRPGSA